METNARRTTLSLPRMMDFSADSNCAARCRFRDAVDAVWDMALNCDCSGYTAGFIGSEGQALPRKRATGGQSADPKENPPGQRGWVGLRTATKLSDMAG